jgi:hypothetical protein
MFNRVLSGNRLNFIFAVDSDNQQCYTQLEKNSAVFKRLNELKSTSFHEYLSD